MLVVSKLLSVITQPLFWLVLWLVVALLLLGLFDRWRRAALGMLWAGLVLCGLIGFSVIPGAMLRPLENR